MSPSATKGFDRTDRLGEEVRKHLDHLIRNALSDPRVKGTFSLTRVDVTRDLRYAKVRVSIMEEENQAALIKALKSAAGFLRHELGKALTARYTPELLFEADGNIAYGVHIAKVLKDMNLSDETAEDSPHEPNNESNK